MATPVLAQAPGQGVGTENLDACLVATQVLRPGQYTKVEFLRVTTKGVPTFAIEVLDYDDREWEFNCNALNGVVYAFEREVNSPSAALFDEKVSLEKAKQTVSSLYPGEILEVEYEVESNGRPSYEIDIQGGRENRFIEYKVEVDAISGEIQEVNVETWEIGIEPEERPKN